MSNTITSDGSIGTCVRCGLACGRWSQEFLGWIHTGCEPRAALIPMNRDSSYELASIGQLFTLHKALEARVDALEKKA